MTETEARKHRQNKDKEKKEAIAEVEHQRVVEELKNTFEMVCYIF